MLHADDVLAMVTGAAFAVVADLLGWFQVHQWWMEAGNSLLLGLFGGVGAYLSKRILEKINTNRKTNNNAR